MRPEINKKNPALDSQALLDESIVEDTFRNNASVNDDSFKKNRSYLAGFAEGRSVLVTYFSRNAPITDVYSDTADYTTKYKDDVHLIYTQIRNFEIRVTSEFSFEYEEDKNTSKISGEGVTFPGFIPKIGDIFFYKLRNDKVGVFNITGIQRLALGQETYHKVTFLLESWVDTQIRDQMQRQSSTICYFDKEKFLIGDNAYLTTQGYIDQNDLRQLRQEITQNYTDRFYDESVGSFMRPDDIYDPYVVEYWNQKVSITENRKRPTQLLIAVDNYKKTIWSLLTRNPIKNLKNLSKISNTKTYHNTFWGANITSLLGHTFLYIGDEAAAVTDPTIDKNGTPMLVDTTPHFHTHQWDEEIKKHADKEWGKMRRNFYGDFLPNRECPPHQHSAHEEFPFDPKLCSECEFYEHASHFHHHRPHFLFAPPYPIRSDAELQTIWLKLKHLPEDTKLTTDQEAQCRGYILWYRETYQGTLSATELEQEWRIKGNLTSDAELTKAQQASLKAYIDDYRSKFLPVLSDRELEIAWRVHKRIDFGAKIDANDKAELLLVIQKYRDDHGNVPQDQLPLNTPILGSPITTEEIEQAGAVTYNQALDLNISLEELHNFTLGNVKIDQPQIVPDAYLPLVYVPRHPRPHHELHCHSICHLKCGIHAKDKDITTTTATTSAYALSNEFYLGSAAMDPFESVLYKLITNQEVDPHVIVNLIADYLSWDDETAFYREMFALYMIDKALYWLRYHS